MASLWGTSVNTTQTDHITVGSLRHQVVLRVQRWEPSKREMQLCIPTLYTHLAGSKWADRIDTSCNFYISCTERPGCNCKTSVVSHCLHASMSWSLISNAGRSLVELSQNGRMTTPWQWICVQLDTNHKQTVRTMHSEIWRTWGVAVTGHSEWSEKKQG